MTDEDMVYADLDNLLAAAKHDLPMLADQLKALKGYVSSASSDEYSAFARIPQNTGSGTYGPPAAGVALGQWQEARSDLQGLLGRGAEHLYAAAEALTYIARMYAAADGESSERFKNLSKEWGGPSFPTVPPQYLTPAEKEASATSPAHKGEDVTK